MEIDDAITYVRRDIGDPPIVFVTNALSDGLTSLFDLPQRNINAVGLTVLLQTDQGFTTTLYPTITPGTQTAQNFYGVPYFQTWAANTNYNANALVQYTPVGSPTLYYQALAANDNITPGSNAAIWQSLIVYTLDTVNGVLQFNSAIPLNNTLIVNGTSWAMFTDSDLTDIIYDAVRQHCMGQTIQERFRDAQGFITYREQPKDIDNLPKMEETLVVTLADIDAMWILATDAATDVNVQTAEGTNIDRSARYNQLMTHIGALREKYEQYCGQLGVGLYRIETITMRRTSRTNNRLVPIFEPREYDDHRYPTRQLPQIDSRDQDTSGVPSPIWNGLPL